MARIARSAAERLHRPVDAASCAAFRIAFGVLAVVGSVRVAAHGWIEALYVAPSFHFTYLGFDWVRPGPALAMDAVFALMAAAGACIALGWRYRLATAFYALAFTYVELIDRATYLNHYYWVSLVAALMIGLPLHRAASLDARRLGLAPVVPAWVVLALRLQVGLVYLWAGVAKLNPEWLGRGMPLRLWLAAHADLPIVGPWLALPAVALAASWAAAAFDLSIPLWLIWRRTRAAAYLAVVGFHAATAALFPIGMFPWLMIAATPIFFEPLWPRRVAGRVRRLRSAAEPSGAAEGVVTSGADPSDDARSGLPSPLGRLALAAFFGAQLLLPLRHWLYPGDRLWTEEGFRFSWHVMLIEKGGQVDFRVRDGRTGERWVVAPEAYLTPLQARMMRTQPDMIHQLARHVAADFAARGHPGVAVYADAFVSLNGRASRRIVDPEVDLARAPFGLGPKPWILREPGPPPAAPVSTRLRTDR